MTGDDDNVKPMMRVLARTCRGTLNGDHPHRTIINWRSLNKCNLRRGAQSGEPPKVGSVGRTRRRVRKDVGHNFVFSFFHTGIFR